MKKCPRCGAVHDGRRWIPEPDEELSSRIMKEKQGEKACPGCEREARRQVDGVVTLGGSFLDNHREEILNVVGRVSRNRRRRNVTSRVLSFRNSPEEIVIETCDEHLAERIGKEIQKAFKGDLEMKWQNRDSFVRVSWLRD
jgi:NMD protein affecting ribosome stability and mRNA decay